MRNGGLDEEATLRSTAAGHTTAANTHGRQGASNEEHGQCTVQLLQSDGTYSGHLRAPVQAMQVVQGSGALGIGMLAICLAEASPYPGEDGVHLLRVIQPRHLTVPAQAERGDLREMREQEACDQKLQQSDRQRERSEQ